MSDMLSTLLVALVLLVSLSLLLREFRCWYWKIDRAIELLKSIDESLKQLPAVRQYDDQGQRMAKA